MNKKIPYGKQWIDDDDIDAVVKVLKSDYLTQGPRVGEFEDAFAKYIGSKYAVAVSNGTAALHLCTLALGVKAKDKVITTPLTFVASANCIRYAGGDVVFADIDPQTHLIDIDKVRLLLNSAPKGTYHGIIVVDFAGRAVNLQEFKELANKYNCWIIEDACHAPGGYFTDDGGIKHHCGNGDFADLAIFSFHPVKHIAAGEGGMITTNNKDLYNKLRNLRSHGIQQIPEFNHENHGLWYYEMQELGFNYRLTDIQAALGKSQLKKAEEGLIKRKAIAKVYDRVFANKPYIKRQTGVVIGHAYHLYVVEVENRDALHKYMRDKDIYAQIHYIPVHLMHYYKQFGWKDGDFPIAEEYYKNCISLPMYPTLKDEEQVYVIKVIEEFYE